MELMENPQIRSIAIIAEGVPERVSSASRLVISNVLLMTTKACS
jgi:hypothetical protein